MQYFKPEWMVLLMTDTEGAGYSMPRMLEFEIVKSFDSPAQSLEFLIPWTEEMPEMRTVSIYNNGERLFLGSVDEQVMSENDRGRTIKVSARSRGGLLLDNEAKPQLYGTVTLATIFKNHVYPYGFLEMRADQNPYFNKFLVPKGMSEWEVISTFYQSAYMGSVRIDDDDMVYCQTKPPVGQTIRIGNNDPTALPYTNLKEVNNRFAPITQFKVRDKAGAYSYTYDNSAFIDFNLMRTRYLNPAVQYTASDNGGIFEAQLRVRQSMLSKRVITVTLPGLLRVKTCDHADLQTPFQQYKDQFVHQVRHKLSPSGFETTLTLLNYQYI